MSPKLIRTRRLLLKAVWHVATVTCPLIAGALLGQFFALSADAKKSSPQSTPEDQATVVLTQLWEGYWGWIIAVGVLLVAIVVLAFNRKHLREQPGVQTKLLLDALAVAARRIADTEHKTERDKKSDLGALCTHLVGALVRAYPAVEDVRAIAYLFNREHTKLIPAYDAGTRRPSGPFLITDQRGKAAIDFAHKSEKAWLQEDTRKGAEGWRGSGDGYRCFIAAPILSAGDRYGMLTIDAKAPYALTPEDELVVQLAASLIGIAKASIKGRVKLSDPMNTLEEPSGGGKNGDSSEAQDSQAEVGPQARF
ncbi:transcriptional regulator with GAF, ATPase, and Fis domain [Arthrobacter globiformis]|uniref:GAF domain-containing protein n=1 Tax=Arthrobacter globiformis TaxID=1665 RepID=UPI00278AA05F|nr:GAF domain-containing protein [Arthrobacter globiformis]MDQ1058161.1 transcriptional regulator with GAF, ATPase, and Fis domain [Arthrobacter globiformis]